MAVDLSAQEPPFKTRKVTLDATAGDATKITLPTWCKVISVRIFTTGDEDNSGSIAGEGTDSAAQSDNKLNIDNGAVGIYPINEQGSGEKPVVYIAADTASSYAQIGLFASVDAALSLGGSNANYVNVALTDITVLDTNSPPALVSEGIAILGNPKFLHLLCRTSTSGADGPVEFKIWHWFTGPNIWVLDRTFAADGIIKTLLVVATEALLLSIEAPGDRVFIEVTTSSAVLTLTVSPIAVVEK